MAEISKTTRQFSSIRAVLTASSCLVLSSCAPTTTSPAPGTTTSPSPGTTTAQAQGTATPQAPTIESAKPTDTSASSKPQSTEPEKTKTTSHGRLGSTKSIIPPPPPTVQPPSTAEIIQKAVKSGAIRVEPVKMRSISSLLHFSGHIEPEFGKEVDVSSRINGKITHLFIHPGEVVETGQKLATIDSREVSEMEAELVEAKSKLQIAEAHREREREILNEQVERPESLLDAQSKLEQIKLKKNLAESEFKRQEGLFKEKITSARDYNTAKEKLAECALELRSATIDVQREERLYKNKALMSKDYQLADAECKRDQQHMHTLEQRLLFLGMDKQSIKHLLSTSNINGEVNIKSSAHGVISHFDVAVGEIVTPEKSLFKITDLSEVVASFDVPEPDLQRVKMGTQVNIIMPSYRGKTFSAPISFISDHVHAETRMVSMRAKLDNKGSHFKLNMRADITLVGAPFEVLACPKAAMHHDTAEKPFVFRQNGDAFERVAITVGGASSEYVEVVSGLKEGDNVVVSGSNFLR